MRKTIVIASAVITTFLIRWMMDWDRFEQSMSDRNGEEYAGQGYMVQYRPGDYRGDW